MVSLSQSAFLNGIEPSRYVTCESNLTSNMQEPTSHLTCQGSPTMVDRRKSRIPRYIPSPPSIPKSPTSPVDKIAVKYQRVITEKAKVRYSAEVERTKANTKLHSEQRIRSASANIQQTRLTAPTIASSAKTLPFVAIVPTPKTLPVETLTSEPMEVEIVTDSLEEKVPQASQSHLTESRAQITTPKSIGRKDSTRRDRPARYLSDARKIKRMVTGVAPLDAAVDCAAAPEWRSRSPLGSTSEVEVTCVPRPQNLHITRRVGVDGVVIAWAPLEHDCVAGFQVLVGGRVVQHVRSPHRTKALVTGLPLAGSFTIGLVTVAEDGRCSTPVIVTQDRTRVYTTRNSSARPLRRGLPTCL